MGLWQDARALLGFPKPPPESEPLSVEQAVRDAVHGSRLTFDLPAAVTGAPMAPGAPTYPGIPPGVGMPWEPPVQVAPNGFPIGRLSWDTSLQVFGANAYVIMPPDESVESWRLMDLDANTLKGISANRLLDILSNASPDVSRALFDAHTMLNPGWEATAYRIDGDKLPHKRGQKVVDLFFDMLTKKHGAADVVINKGSWAMLMRGAFMAELVLDEDGRMPVELATPDPATARYLLSTDPTFGPQYLLGQYQSALWVPLWNRETVIYVPLHPAGSGAPYGRPPFAPAIFASVFLLGLLGDLRRVVSQQGYPRYDIAILLDKLRASFQQSQADPASWSRWVSASITEVQNAYNALKPDSVFIHTDVVQVNRPTGAVNADVLNAVDSLIRALERLLARALKTMPLLLGTADASSEANSNRQWEIHSAGISSVQNLMAQVWSRLLTLMCEAQGVPCQVEMQFGVLRQAEEFRDAQTEAQQIENEQNKYFQGWTDQDEGSIKITGHPAKLRKPREMPKTEQPLISSDQPTTVGQGTGGGAPDQPAIADTQKQDKPDEDGKDDSNSRAPMMAVWLPPSSGARQGRILRWVPDPSYPNGHADQESEELRILERIV